MDDVVKFAKDTAELYFQNVQQLAKTHDALVIYGAGECGKALYFELKKLGIEIKNFCITKRDTSASSIDGVPIISLDESVAANTDALYLLAVQDDKVQNALERELLSRNICSYLKMSMMIEAYLRNICQKKERWLEITPKIGCTINCKYCPQAALIKAYNGGQREMSFNEFKECIDKVPEDVGINFAGFVEPFLAKDIIPMIKYAAKRKSRIWLYTTLVGLTKDMFDQIKDIPFTRVILHLPDKNNFAHIPTTDDYFQLLEYVMNTRRSDGSFFVSTANSQCEPNSRAYSIVKDKVSVSWKMHSRAGNLNDEALISSPHKKIVGGGVFTATSLWI